MAVNSTILPKDAARIIADHLAGADREHLVVLMLDAQSRVLGTHTVSIGTLTSTLVSARDVYKAAILANAALIIVGHNHPSGNPEPSAEDNHVTRTLVGAEKLLGIELLDHVVVGEKGKFASIKRSGAWPVINEGLRL